VKSCIYEGLVRHGRRQPVEHAFRYRVFMMYLDLDELDVVFRGRWFWSTRRKTLARFDRSHHLGGGASCLKTEVLDLVQRETGRRPEGPVRLLTNLSYYGFCFNPVSFYYCYAKDGETLETIVAEVNNTPWGQRDAYVLAATDNEGKGAALRFRPRKKMHVSPFMPMNVDYDWSFIDPGERLSVFMANDIEGERVFSASLLLGRRAITTGSLARVLIVYPFMTLKVIAGIYWQALRLWWKRAPFFEHPDKNKSMVTQ